MLTVWELNALQKEVSETNINKWKVGKNISWVDCIKPDELELKQLSEITKIPLKHLKENLDPKKRAHLDLYDEYSVASFHALCDDDRGKQEITTVSMILFKKSILTIHNKAILGLEKLRMLPKSQLLETLKKGSHYFMCSLMDYVTDDFFRLLEDIEDDVNKLEDQVIRDPTELVSKQIFMQKKRLIFAYKALSANREVLSAVEKYAEMKGESFMLMREVYTDVTHLIDLVSTYRDILTNVLDVYLSSVSNSLNSVMKVLTVITAFIMVPTLIAGIYGMNFQKTSAFNMPELYWAFGYPFALGLMVVSIILLYFLFKKKGWL